MSTKRVYTFGNGQAEGKADMRNLLGGKGANLVITSYSIHYTKLYELQLILSNNLKAACLPYNWYSWL